MGFKETHRVKGPIGFDVIRGESVGARENLLVETSPGICSDCQLERRKYDLLKMGGCGVPTTIHGKMSTKTR